MWRLLILGAALGGCASSPQGAAELTKVVNVEYSKFGACAFRALRDHGISPKLADLRGEEAIVIAISNPTAFTGELTEIEFNIKRLDAAKSRVDVRSRFGIQRISEVHWKIIAGCAEDGGTNGEAPETAPASSGRPAKART